MNIYFFFETISNIKKYENKNFTTGPIILIFDTFAISILKNLFTPLNSFFFSPEDFSKIVSENSVIRSFERFFVIPTTLLKDLIYSWKSKPQMLLVK